MLLLLLVVVAAACGGGSDDTPARAGGGGELRGRTFLSTAVDGHELVAGTELRLSFGDDGTLAASAGCNQFVGALSFDGDVVVVRDLGGTEMGCDAGRHAQDEWFTAFLSARPTYALDADGTLTLTGDGVTLELLDREVADPDVPLAGTRWVVDTILEGSGPDGSASSVPQGVEAFLQFGEGVLEGHDGCRPVRARYTVDGDDISYTDREFEDIACPTADVERLAGAILAATSDKATYRIQAKRLTLTDAAGRGISAVAG